MGWWWRSWWGVGGFGSVYRARRKEGGRYALKFIPLGWAADRALREFAVLLRVRHPNLVQVGALGLWPEKKPEYLWLQLGFVEGERLDAWAKRRNPDSRGVARRVLEVARGAGGGARGGRGAPGREGSQHRGARLGRRGGAGGLRQRHL